MKESLTIVVPIYNEEENIERLCKELNDFVKKSIIETQILFINDGSNDNSEKLINNQCSTNDKFRLLSFKKNSGLSAAIKAGFDYTNTSLVGYIDADLQTDPEDFNLLLDKISDYDLVTGVRTKRKDSLVKNISSFIANSIRRLFTNDNMDDTGCPLKIIKTSFAKKNSNV